MEGGAESRVDRLTSRTRGAEMEKQLRGQEGCARRSARATCMGKRSNVSSEVRRG